MQIIDGFNMYSTVFIENLFNKLMRSKKIYEKYNYLTIRNEASYVTAFEELQSQVKNNFTYYRVMYNQMKRDIDTIVNMMKQYNINKDISMKRYIDIFEVVEQLQNYTNVNIKNIPKGHIKQFPLIDLDRMYSFKKIDKRKKEQIYTISQMNNYVDEWKNEIIIMNNTCNFANPQYVKKTISKETLEKVEGYDNIENYIDNANFSLYVKRDKYSTNDMWNWDGLTVDMFDGSKCFKLMRPFKGGGSAKIL